MKMSTLVLGLSAALVPLFALAHQEGHGDDQKPLAATCTQLEYPQQRCYRPVHF